MPRIRVKVEGFYEVDPEHYPEGSDLGQMAEIDASNVKNDPIMAICLADDPIEVTIEPWSNA